MELEYKLNLHEFIGRKDTALVGRENGQKLLERLKKNNIIFKTIESNNKKIIIEIPKRIITINKSFFLGFLSTRIQELGKDAFIEKYNFNTNEHIIKQIKDEYINYALKDSINFI